jgi:hypothetical protein
MVKYVLYFFTIFLLFFLKKGMVRENMVFAKIDL